MYSFAYDLDWKKTIKKPYKAYLSVLEVGDEIYNEIYEKTEVATTEKHILVDTDIGDNYLIDEAFAKENFSISEPEIGNRTIVYANPEYDKERISALISEDFLKNYYMFLEPNTTVGDYLMKVDDDEIFVVSKKVFGYFYQTIWKDNI